MSQDLFLILGWWAVLFLIGAAALPLTRKLFSSWWDQGYLLSKAVGLAGVTFITWYLGSYKLLPFTQITILISLFLLFSIGVIAQNLSSTQRIITSILGIIGIQSPFKQSDKHKGNDTDHQMISWRMMIILEVFFLVCLSFWSYIKAFEPDIRGLEKFMDYGFAKTIYNSSYFPPPDMWYAGGTINYYYFGHMTMALLSKLSSIDLAYGYNLMLTTIFALCFTMSFSISCQLLRTSMRFHNRKIGKKWYIIVGLLSAYLVTLAGNMQTIYAFTKGYNGEDTPPPFWKIIWPVDQFFTKLPEGLNTYWYANATRFIPFTIHEFPSYSFVVSDNHGHVLSIPFALLAIASLLTLFASAKATLNREKLSHLAPYGLYGVLSGILLMTNALDGPIYMGLFSLLLLFQSSSFSFLSYEWLWEKGERLGIAVIGVVLTALPFLLTFTSFANGLAVNCPPKALENMKFGPIIFETVDKCQKSPMWMVSLLWGFFFFCGTTLIIKQLKFKSLEFNVSKRKFFEFSSPVEKFLITVFFYCVGLIFFAEFFYFKDIYPAHFRSNTMFKLGYQAFMMCSLLCGYVIVNLLQRSVTATEKPSVANALVRTWGKRLFFILLIPQLFLVSIFPFFSVRSYFGNLQTYKGLYGLSWFQREYPDDFAAMEWISTRASEPSFAKATVGKQSGWSFLKNLSKMDSHVHDNFFTSHLATIPVIIEADGDSYTDFDRMSAFAGMPTVVGWGVHEWLWRGTYDVVSPRKDEVAAVYEGNDPAKRLEVLNKYNVHYIIVGDLERKKFTKLAESELATISHEVFRSGNTVIYEKN